MVHSVVQERDVGERSDHESECMCLFSHGAMGEIVRARVLALLREVHGVVDAWLTRVLS